MNAEFALSLFLSLCYGKHLSFCDWFRMMRVRADCMFVLTCVGYGHINHTPTVLTVLTDLVYQMYSYYIVFTFVFDKFLVGARWLSG